MNTTKTEPIRIIDIINHRYQYGEQIMLILNRLPKPLFERKGIWLIGNDDCVFQFYKYGHVSPNSSYKAFAGREFDIPMKDGSVEHANGQWWHDIHEDFNELVYSLGMSTIENLNECYVFCGCWCIDQEIVDEWLGNKEPSNNYHKYNKRHQDFGKHKIVSPWETESA